ncbi:NADPH-dependent F420 reductase [Streptomyces sp. NPDC006923]|uniref:NADPH-dependent F420 reductase n=1 Tax=Streptomyces sp. NPDC006923 TaxID=3155355 RepID=UPI0033D2D005
MFARSPARPLLFGQRHATPGPLHSPGGRLSTRAPGRGAVAGRGRCPCARAGAGFRGPAWKESRGSRVLVCMATLGLIGSGHIGSTLARLAVDAGLDVVLSNSRGPETLSELVAELGPRARAGTAEEAAAAGDWVVVTIPLKAYQQVPVEPLAGKTVIDTNNYYPDRDGKFPALDSGETTSSELLQRHLKRSQVVKAFNNIYFKHLAALPRPAGAADRTALPIAGDDATAKVNAAELINTLGFDTVDAGPLAEGWRFEPGTPVYGTPYTEKSTSHFVDVPAGPAAADRIAEDLAAAKH